MARDVRGGEFRAADPPVGIGVGLGGQLAVQPIAAADVAQAAADVSVGHPLQGTHNIADPMP